MNNYTKLAFHVIKVANIKNAGITHVVNYDDPYANERRFNTSAPGRYFGMHALNEQTLAENPLSATAGAAAGVLLPAALGALIGKGSAAGGYGDPDINPFVGALAGAGISTALGGPTYLAKLMAQGATKETRKEKLNEAHRSLISNSILGNAGKLALLGALSGGVISSELAGVGGAFAGARGSDLATGMLESGATGAAIGGGAGLLAGLINSAIYKNVSPETRARSIENVASSPGSMSLPFGTVIKSLE